MKPVDLEYKILEAFSRMKHINLWESFGDFSRSEIQILGVISCRGGENVKIQELCSATGMQPASVSRSLKGLEKNGLIIRSADPDNRRNVIVSATPEGKKIAGDTIEKAHDYWKDVLSRMSETDLTEMLRLWNAVMDNMEQVLSERKAEGRQ